MSGRILDDYKFEVAYEHALCGPKHDFPAKIGDGDIASGIEDPLVSPIDKTIILGHLQDPVPGTMKLAAEKAAKAFKTWSRVSCKERSAILTKVADVLEKRLYRTVADVVLSSGMVRKDAFAETCTCLDIICKAAEDAKALKGRAQGVWGVIALDSSPLASVIGYSVAAIAAGNTVVMMPSGHCCYPVYSVFDIFKQAGLPAGVMNLVCDRFNRFATELSEDLNIYGVVVSGCGKTMDDTMFLAADNSLEYVNEVKGMNPIVVAKPSDMKKAADAIIDSAIQNNGKGLYATSKVIVLAENEKDLAKALVERLKDLNIDDPAEKECQMGPLQNKEEEKKFLEILEDEAAYVVTGGKRVNKEHTAEGLYYTPILLAGVNSEDDIQFIDSGLPVIVLKQVIDMREAVEDLDETDCGLSVGIMSGDGRMIFRMKEFAAERGLCLFINSSSRSLKAAVKAKTENFIIDRTPLRRSSYGPTMVANRAFAPLNTVINAL